MTSYIPVPHRTIQVKELKVGDRVQLRYYHMYGWRNEWKVMRKEMSDEFPGYVYLTFKNVALSELVEDVDACILHENDEMDVVDLFCK